MTVIKCFNNRCREYDPGAVDHCGAVLVSITTCPKGIIRKDKPPTNDYARALASNECACGNNKKPGYAFCYGCYQELPNKMRRALWSRMGQGFEEAYEEATKELEERFA